MRIVALCLALASLAACRPQAVGQRMWNHYQHVATVQDAVLGTNLDAARSAGRWVAEHADSAGMPAAALPYVDSMRIAGYLIANATDLDVAANATARMAYTCGACHEATGMGPVAAAIGAPPPSGDTLVGMRMDYQQWAADRLWDGIAIPSDRSWAAGAVAMSDVPRYMTHIHRAGPRTAFADSMAQRIHALGERAPLAPRSDRVTIYGEMLSTCAACHQAYRVQLPEAAVVGF